MKKPVPAAFRQLNRRLVDQRSVRSLYWMRVCARRDGVKLYVTRIVPRFVTKYTSSVVESQQARLRRACSRAAPQGALLFSSASDHRMPSSLDRAHHVLAPDRLDEIRDDALPQALHRSDPWRGRLPGSSRSSGGVRGSDQIPSRVVSFIVLPVRSSALSTEVAPARPLLRYRPMRSRMPATSASADSTMPGTGSRPRPTRPDRINQIASSSMPALLVTRSAMRSLSRGAAPPEEPAGPRSR